jgi:cation diffusion facilitator family transporter
MTQNRAPAGTTITARRVVVTSFLVDLLDIALNLAMVIITGSVVMITELFEGIADLVASGFLLVGLKRSARKPDRSHPFGHGKAIYVWALLAGIVMFGVTSVLSIYLGWERLNNPQEVHDPGLAIVVLVITLSTNAYGFHLSLSRLLRRRSVKEAIGIFFRSSLVETKTTLILDLMGASASLLGLIALSIYAITGEQRLDGLGAMAIGITLALLSLALLKGIGDLIVGQSASPETERNIREAALSMHEVREVRDLKTMHLGPDKLLVLLDVHMQDGLDSRELVKLNETMKKKIRTLVPAAKHIQIELEAPTRRTRA